MKKPVLLLLAIIVLFSGISTAVIAEDIKVMSYNIKYGRGTDNEVNIDRIAQIIEDSGADIIGLQEIDQETSRANGYDTPKYIADKLGMYYAYGPNMSVHGGLYGNAILSRYPILSHKNYKLAREGLSEQRGFLLAEIKVGNQIMNFASTHLEHKKIRLRVKQVKDILEITENVSKPMIIVGDFNDHAVTTPIMLMARHYNDAQSLFKMTADYQELSYEEMIDGNLTFPSTGPKSRIDYIFSSEDFILKEDTDAFQVINADGSDHLPVVADFILPDNSPPSVDVAIVKSNKMQEWSEKLKLTYQEGIENASTLLEELNYSYNVIESSRLSNLDLSNIKLLVLPDLRQIDIADQYKLLNYSLNGGKILALNQVAIKPEFVDTVGFISDILGIKYNGWNRLRPLHGFISQKNEHFIWQDISSDIMMDSNKGMVISTTEEGKVIGEWYNDFRSIPSHPDYKNGAIVEGNNSIYIAKNLFLNESFNNDEVKQLLTNCLVYLMNE